jgi:hypothetical protein
LLLYAYRENESLLVELEFLKIPYLFTSANLLKMLDVTPSVKTRLSMISAIGPRLIDPTAKAKELRELFRFSNDQDHVMSVLKQREKIQAASRFSKSIGKPGPGTSLGGSWWCWRQGRRRSWAIQADICCSGVGCRARCAQSLKKCASTD